PPRPLCSPLPLDRANHGAPTGLGLEFELVHETTGARKTEPETGTRGVPVGQREVDVGDARTLVGEREPQPCPVIALDILDLDPPPAAVHERVAGQLARRRHDFRLVHERQLRRDGRAANELPNSHHVLIGANLLHHSAQRGGVGRATGTSHSLGHSVSVTPGVPAASFRPFGPTSRAPRSISSPCCAVSAVRTPRSGRPSSTSVIATAGRMPTTTVSAFSIRETEA